MVDGVTFVTRSVRKARSIDSWRHEEHEADSAGGPVELARLVPAATIAAVHYDGCTHFKDGRAQVGAAFTAAGIIDRLVWLERGVSRDL